MRVPTVTLAMATTTRADNPRLPHNMVTAAGVKGSGRAPASSETKICRSISMAPMYGLANKKTETRL